MENWNNIVNVKIVENVIKLENIDYLDNIVKLENANDNQFEKKFFKYKNKIQKFNNEAYKYGVSWIDYWIIKRIVKKLNFILVKYNTQVIL
jgi:hypothetical protein